MVSFTGASFQRWSTLQRPRHTEVLTRLFVLLCFNILGLDLKLTAKWPKQTQKGWIKGFINGSPFEPDEFSPTCELLIFISHRVQIFSVLTLGPKQEHYLDLNVIISMQKIQNFQNSRVWMSDIFLKLRMNKRYGAPKWCKKFVV